MVVVLVLCYGVMVVKVAQLDPSTLFGLPKRSGPIIFHWISARRAPIIIISNIISLIIISSPELLEKYIKWEELLKKRRRKNLPTLARSLR
jgi:hypothetical protein